MLQRSSGLPVLLAVLAAAGPCPVAPGAGAQSFPSDAAVRALEFRHIGPFRGGRVTAVEGVPGRPHTFFHGSTGGGVWKTENAGRSWHNVTDGWLDVGSIGAVEVADADPNVIYVGTGSADIRGNVSIGRGAWRSDDGGDTWRFLGLREAGQIARIRTHPDDPERVWLAATGHPFGRNEERGVFRSADGGESWEKVLFLSDSVGAVDLSMDATNPRVLFAAMWRGERKPWTMISGAREGGIYRTTDGGDSWEKLGGGLPGGLVGKIGVSVSPASPERVWAIVEAREDPGLYRSDDGGDTWALVNTNPRLWTRPWYYNHVYADPVDPNTVWIAGNAFWKSVDAGESFDRLAMPHGDHHDLWINPRNPRIMVEGNDGGANVSLDGGRSWSSQLNQPTAEFYNVTVDDRFPYRVYGSQQDNSTLSLPMAATGNGITLQHWLAVGGCETGPVAVRPGDPLVVYAGCFGGRFARFDRAAEQFRQIRPYPQTQDAMPERELRYRFQWNFPAEISPHDPGVLYVGSQHVHRTTNEGRSWEEISPDLTGRDTARFGMAGGPITHDVTGVEIWSALLAIQESPHTPGVIWTGSNDGTVHLTRNGGESWAEVTPRELPRPSTVNRIHVSGHRPGKAYVVAYRYRLDDWRPYVYRTEDFGESWTRISDGTRGVPTDHPTRALVEDPEQEGLLFLGTEFGLFASFDDGASWRPLQQNLPRTPVTDLAIQERFGDLVVATQGRGFWIADDLTLLREQARSPSDAPAHLFPPRDAYRSGWVQEDGHYDRDRVHGAMLPRYMKGTNPPAGAIVYYELTRDRRPMDVSLVILDADGDTVRSFDDVPSGAGSHRFTWDLRYGGLPPGWPRAVPGEYAVRLTVGEWSDQRRFRVLEDPRLTNVTVADLREQLEYLQRARARMEELQAGLRAIEQVRQQTRGTVEEVREVYEGPWVGRAASLADTVAARLGRIEDELVQTEGGGWDRQARLQRQLSFLLTAAQSQRGVPYDARPTDQMWERLQDLETRLADLLSELNRVLDEDVGRLNTLLLGNGVNPVLVPGAPGA